MTKLARVLLLSCWAALFILRLASDHSYSRPMRRVQANVLVLVNVGSHVALQVGQFAGLNADEYLHYNGHSSTLRDPYNPEPGLEILLIKSVF